MAAREAEREGGIDATMGAREVAYSEASGRHLMSAGVDLDQICHSSQDTLKKLIKVHHTYRTVKGDTVCMHMYQMPLILDSQELDTFTAKAKSLYESTNETSESTSQMVEELVQQFELLSTANGQFKTQILTSNVDHRVSQSFHENECEERFGELQQLISQLALRSEMVTRNNKLLKQLSAKADQLKLVQQEHMREMDNILFPLIVQSFTTKTTLNFVQHLMLHSPTETAQAIKQQLMANRDNQKPSSPLSIPLELSTESAIDLFSKPVPTLPTNAPVVASSHKGNRWSAADDQRLQAAVERHNCKNWKLVAECLPGRNSTQCYHRYITCPLPLYFLSLFLASHACMCSQPHRWHRMHSDTTKGNFTPDEDRVLISAAQGSKQRHNWSQVANLLPGRNSKQCRDRWFNVLNPLRKRSKWTIEEDTVALEAYERLGNSWSSIQQLLPGRTQLQVRDRLRTLHRRHMPLSTAW
jgi:iron-sulfur cluster repair protein YtfE (RIC family)